MKASQTILPAGSRIALLLASVLLGSVAQAQSAPTLDLWDVCTPAGGACETTQRSIFTVDQDGGFVARGVLGLGTIPASGPGLRTMWYPFKGAFRTGSAGDVGGSSTAWDDANVGFYSFAGGFQSRATAFASFAFGDQVSVTGVDAAGFGASSTVSGTVGFSAGASNTCSGFGCVTLGYFNQATGQGSASMGYRSIADGTYTLALGHRATTCAGTNITLDNGNCPSGGRTGAITIADASTTDYVGASANNQFTVRAAGGYRLFTNSGLTLGVALSPSGSSWSLISDRNMKENFAEIDGEALLQRISLLPMHTWRYIDQEDTRIRHIGPVAQDWQELIAGPLDLNDEGLTINQGDYDGVNLAAIKALTERTGRLDAENAELRAELAQLKRERLDQAERLQLLESMVMRLASDRPIPETIAGRD